MRVAVFSSKPWDEHYLVEANQHHELEFLEAQLDRKTVALAEGADAVCVFVNDTVDAAVIET